MVRIPVTKPDDLSQSLGMHMVQEKKKKKLAPRSYPLISTYVPHTHVPPYMYAPHMHMSHMHELYMHVLPYMYIPCMYL